jgi:hypothetical protein
MRKRGIFCAIGLLLVINAFVLAGVQYNRSGDSDAYMTLTERELRTAYTYQEDNSGKSLRIQTHHNIYTALGTSIDDRFGTSDREKLEAIGFDFSDAHMGNNDTDDYFKQLPRKAYTVLEFDGSSWEEWKKKLSDELAKVEQAAAEGKIKKEDLDSARKNIERALITDSHLFIIDFGKDPSALRRQYSDRQHYLILACKVHLSYSGSYSAPGTKGDNLHGYVELLNEEINVPHRLQAGLREQKDTGTGFRKGAGLPEMGPQYQVVLYTGKRYEPWIENLVSMQ